ncbi:centromere/kinetochore protein zw10 homolog isoform X2 [Stegodyphus dumicola]|uniref:centromere/kinetochore protein zw10 homolog isoform X2 n=1 Tax=Stegodyphus dumicola TaxID=202533 RepID=UPI0015A84CCB|nr:centromere/kinetochore protein zw10 homolog isoform X2 [Stegodyphus dumicola]
MSSIVAELLQSSGKLTKESIVFKVHDLKTKYEDIKHEVIESLKNKYIEFLPHYHKLDRLDDDLSKITDEFEVLCTQIEREIKPQVVNSDDGFQNILEDLKKTKKIQMIASNLILLHQHLSGAKRALLQSSYLHAARDLLDFELVYKSIDLENQTDAIVIHAIKTEYLVTKTNLIHSLETLWHKKYVINSIQEDKNKKTVTFTIHKNPDEDENVLKTLKLLNNLSRLLKEFGKQFLNVVCNTVLMNNVKIECDVSSVLTLTIINEQSPMPEEVFETLTQIFLFLNSEIFYLPTDIGKDNSGHIAMSEFGKSIEKDFCSLVIEKCLKTIVPKQSKQLDAFHKEIVSAEKFCSVLKELKFFTMPENKLLEFIYSVDTLPVDKMTQDIMNRARSFMKKSLHQTVTVGSEIESSGEKNITNLNETDQTKNQLSKSAFIFPRCQISTSVKDLKNFLYTIKDEAKNIGSSYVLRIFYVARSICELYCCVVPTFHKQEIESVPQQTAHYLCVLGTVYECDLESDIPKTFVDLVQDIRRLGTEAFLCQMRCQREQLLQLLKELKDYQNIVTDDGLVNKAEKAVRQCLCQLQLLKKAWSDILPVQVYFKAIGTLLNTCLEEIMSNVLSLEDIAAEAAAQLDSIFGILLKEGSDLFKISSTNRSNAVHLYVRSLTKFQEMHFLLCATMKEIVDRWAGGKGSLATHFRPEEVRHMIMAFFENSEKRVAALSKIK